MTGAVMTRRDALALLWSLPMAARLDAQQPGAGWRRIVTGQSHAMILEPGGTLRTWSSDKVSGNRTGVFGLGHNNPMPVNTLVPVPGLSNVVSAAAASDCSFAVLADGRLLAWGSQYKGQLGTTRREEIRVGLMPKGDAFAPTPLAVPFDAADVSAGRQHVLALTRDGSVYAWGDGSFGRLGIGEMPTIQISTNMPRTLQDVLYPVRVPDLTGVTAISAGEEHSLALLGDGTVRAWGRNNSGQLGDGTKEDRTTPVAVTSVRTAIAIAAGGTCSAALLADGTMMTWGDGQALGRKLSLNAALHYPTPAPVAGLPPLQAIGVGWGHMLALTKAGAVFSWGDDVVGETGLGGRGGQTPQQIPRLGKVHAVYTKYRRSFAVLEDGKIQIWGTPVPEFARPRGHPDISPFPMDLLVEGLDTMK